MKTRFLERPSGQVGTVTGIVGGVIFGTFIAVAMRSFVFGLVEGLIFGAIMGAFFAWRVRNQTSIAVLPDHWTSGIAIAFFTGLLVTVVLFIESLAYKDTGLAIAWAIIGVAYMALVAALPRISRHADTSQHSNTGGTKTA